MKIAVLMDAPLRATLLSEKTMARLAEWGEVAVNETDKAEKETVKQIIAGADIAITSWGVPQLDKEILDCAPNLRFVAHAAGSVKGIVSDELYARGIRVVSSARILSYGVSETALGLTICACKNVFAFNEEIRNGGWVEDYSVITELFDITVGVVGCGFAGSHYIELLQAFGVNVLAYDPLLDEAAIAAMGVVQRIMMFGGSAMIGFGQGFQPVCGFNYGAKKYGRVKEAFWFCVLSSTGFLVVLAVVGYIFAAPIVAVFRDDAKVIEVGVAALRMQCLTFPLAAWIVMCNMMSQTIGKAFRASFLAVARQGLFFVPAVLILPKLLGLTGVEISQTAADLISFAFSIPLQASLLKEMTREERFWKN